MQVLVTGASGFIGAHVAGELADRGLDVRGFSRSLPPVHAPLSAWVQGDVSDTDALRRAVRGCDAVVHTAALYSYRRGDAPMMHAVNVEGSRRLCEAAVRAGVRRLVLTSTAATCGPVPGRAATERDRPSKWELTVPYKRTKLAAERIAVGFVERGLEVVCVNPTTVVGPHDDRPTPSGKMIRDLVEGRIRAFVSGAGINVVGVGDVAAGHALALARGRSGERYILGGENMPMADAFAHVAKAVGRRPPSLGVPWPLLYAVGWSGERVCRALGREAQLLVLDEIKIARHSLFFSSEKATSELGYAPTPAPQALAEAAQWFARRSARLARSRATWRIRSAASGSASVRSGGTGS